MRGCSNFILFYQGFEAQKHYRDRFRVQHNDYRAGSKKEHGGQEPGESTFTAIEPYPNKVIKNGFPSLTRVIEKKVEDVPVETFTALKENDVLFIDSTHAVKTGGDVNYEILEILPILQKGVYVHIHDIFLPYEYPKSWLHDKRFWTEQYLVHAFLSYNSSFEIQWMSHFMHRKYPDYMRSAMNFYEASVPFVSSLWIKKIK